MSRESGAKMAVKYYRGKMPWKIKALNFQFVLPEYFVELIDGKKSIVVADVGAGAINTTGTLWPGVDVTMVSSDALADEYEKLWEERGVIPVVKIEKQDMEHMTYEYNSFDIVHCVNAVDHSENPLAAIREMQRICKPGGYVYLRHIPNEGENEKYAGFHQWNINKIGDDASFWSKDDSFILSHHEGWRVEIKTEVANTKYPMEESVVMVWKKPISQ